MPDDALQLQLFAGRLSCQACGGLVDELHRVRRFRICAGCLERVTPSADPHAAEYVQQNAAFWDWFIEMSLRYPTPYRAPTRLQLLTVAAGAFVPTCDCGDERPESRPSPGQPRSLWGLPRQPRCVRCEGRLVVESFARTADELAPDRDDEEWLDLLYQAYRQLFDIGLLPDYWFVLRRQSNHPGG